MRCGPAPPVSLKLNFPLLSALVLAAMSMVVVRLMRMTSSPAAGLWVVPLVTVPERVWASAEARASETMQNAKTAVRRADCASLVKQTPCCCGSFAGVSGARKSALRRLCDRQSRTTKIHPPVCSQGAVVQCDAGRPRQGFARAGVAYGLGTLCFDLRMPGEKNNPQGQGCQGNRNCPQHLHHLARSLPQPRDLAQ